MDGSSDSLKLFISVGAFAISIFALWRTNRIRSSDSFAKLYDEVNGPDFGVDMERIGKWINEISGKGIGARDKISSEDVRLAYRKYYETLYNDSKIITKDDPLERSRRNLKAWFIKCLLFYEGKDISRRHLQALITRDRAKLMRNVFDMTREQTDVWKGLSHQPQSRNSSDEPYFCRLERLADRVLFN